ncbi:hypothetical protein CBS147372_452 [Penicillium roqueforti]|nr:hypothetical protein CBS147372_452 [Penicillium roqueforti]
MGWGLTARIPSIKLRKGNSKFSLHGRTIVTRLYVARLVLERPLLSKQLQSGSIFLFIPYRPVSLLSTTVTPMRLSNDLKPFSRLPHFEAVLLLDEADAFMEQRTSYHDTHNRLVAVFLRRIEYYQGLMFLTTSRKIQLNESIISRIHLTIKYEDLTTEFRREIWRTYLSKANTVQGPAIVGPNELQFLDNLSLNGREIKNLTSIAHALATVGEEPVSYKYLEMAAELSEEFSKEFSEESHVESMYV